MIQKNRITSHWRSAAILLALCSITLSLACVYSLRTEYIITAAQPKLEVNGWNIRPKILSTELRKQARFPDRPENYAISFWASRPLLDRDTGFTFSDIAIDSMVVIYPPGTTSQTLHFNEASFVSYRAVSRDSIVKRFSIVNPETHRLIWHQFPKDAGTLLLQIYFYTAPGVPSLRKDLISGLEVDTILPVQGGFDPIVGACTKVETMVVRVDRRQVAPGLMEHLGK